MRPDERERRRAKIGARLPCQNSDPQGRPQPIKQLGRDLRHRRHCHAAQPITKKCERVEVYIIGAAPSRRPPQPTRPQAHRTQHELRPKNPLRPLNHVRQINNCRLVFDVVNDLLPFRIELQRLTARVLPEIQRRTLRQLPAASMRKMRGLFCRAQPCAHVREIPEPERVRDINAREIKFSAPPRRPILFSGAKA